LIIYKLKYNGLKETFGYKNIPAFFISDHTQGNYLMSFPEYGNSVNESLYPSTWKKD